MKRRAILVGLAAMLAAGAAAWKFQLIGKHYPPTPYDDLLSQIEDREPAIVFGRVARTSLPGAAQLAARLRKDPRSLHDRAKAEPADSKVTEVAGWVVPQSVAFYAALAALA
jgi:hypothetical protein